MQTSEFTKIVSFLIIILFSSYTSASTISGPDKALIDEQFFINLSVSQAPSILSSTELQIKSESDADFSTLEIFSSSQTQYAVSRSSSGKYQFRARFIGSLGGGPIYGEWGNLITVTVESDGCEEVLIPDANFEQALLDSGKDTDGQLNGTICREDAAATTFYELDLREKNINDLTGIEAFTTLKYLYVSNNNLTSINLSKNTNLINFSIHTNNLSDLDVSKNINIEYLHVSNNNLTSLDLSRNKKLRTLHISNNDFTKVDVSKNSHLGGLSVNRNRLTKLDLSKNLLLHNLEVDNNKLTELNLKNNKIIRVVHIQGNNGLRQLNLKSGVNSIQQLLTGNLEPLCILVNQGSAEWIKKYDWPPERTVEWLRKWGWPIEQTITYSTSSSCP